MSVTLLVTVDTEEEFDWLAPVDPESRSVEHMAQLPRLQALFEDLGVRPTYVVDYPIATTELSIDVLSEIFARGACEIGAHLHPWVNPPVEERIEPRHTFLCNLPLALQQEKVARLTDAITDAFGNRPKTFKAGRYGIDFRLVPFLKSLGYTSDTSVIPYMDFSDEQGPCFMGFSGEPFRLGPDYVPGEDGADSLLEVPCTVGFSRRPFRWWSWVHRTLAQDRYYLFRPVGILWHLHVMRKIVLTPENTELADQIRLLKVLGKDRNAVLNVTLHSPSIEPGRTPYVQTERDLQAFLDRLRGTLEFALENLDAHPLTICEFAEQRSRIAAR